MTVQYIRIIISITWSILGALQQQSMVAVSLRIMPPLAATGPHNASNGPAPPATTLSPFYGHPVKLISWHQSELTPSPSPTFLKMNARIILPGLTRVS